MKQFTITALAGTLLLAGIAYAQTLPDTIKVDTAKMEEVLINTPATVSDNAHRHPTSDLVLRINNINEEKLDVLIKYQDNAETSAYAKELQEELVRYGMRVTTLSQEAPVPPYSGSKYVNCSYEAKDALFVITVYPKKGE